MGGMNTTIQFRTNSKIKKEAMKVFKRDGITMSSAFNAFLEEVAFKGSSHVEVYPVKKVPAPYSRKIQKEIDEAIKNGKGYKSAKEYLDDMKNWK